MMKAAPDWTLLQAFLAVADAGSLSAAARATRQSQPTMGRHIKQLEAQLGIALFRRIPSGLEPTEAALPLVEVARSMAENAARLTRMAEGRQEGLRGTVRITASRILSQYTLPPILARLRIAEPEIQIELVPSDTSENLLFREADIALRMYRPEQLDIIARHIADLPIGLYAAKSYLQRRGTPRSAEDLIDHDFIGYDRDERMLRMMRAMGFEVSRDFFALRCDDQTVYWELTRAGCGIGGSQVTVAEDDPLLERVLPDLELPALPLWLAAPQALRSNPRIRRVWDFLAEALGD
ncbi:LysR family transcriptional regulator [Pararhodobacter oceanensis]|uniref:LysR family transcriptional regulator n=1 Tax=Pararhodobacter oceanensis TaxID=2172121 RepID=A0A2T8HR46_9RHOB|nr:LysR family transcriptional regulator [Pararhodobacter oceanensis]PVH27898.1 LysR family transcriptional regulator [Pararhodobacter oceanensis]